MLVPPKLASFEFDEEPASFGESITVQCTVSFGDLPIDIEWLFNAEPINSYSGVSTSKIGKRANVLYIDSVNAKHAGNYTCHAKNKAGLAEHTSVLIVNGIVMEISLHVQ